MKKPILTSIFVLLVSGTFAQKASWTYTSPTATWAKQNDVSFTAQAPAMPDITIYPADTLQKMDGFGACFNELGWEALQTLTEHERGKILNALFSADGAHFTFCRMPVASNDYSFSYYSYDDVPDDWQMRNFNIDRDRYILIPYIKAAQKIVPELKIWASPWSPPFWMKVNNHYSMSGGGKNDWNTDMSAGRKISNNATAFKMENRYLEAYALYLSKFIQAYHKQGIEIARLLVQNEIVYQPEWPSCTWRADDLSFFIGKYLGPRFKADQLKSEIWLGTVNGPDPNYSRTVLNDKDAMSFVKGVGMQWDAKKTISTIHKEYPLIPLMQTESECGNGENNWKSAAYTWSLINHYISNGASSYMYWNMVLDKTGRSTWGWAQNMLISVNKTTGEVKYNPEYYLMKHLSHFVQPGAHLLKTSAGKDYLAFVNPDGELILMIVNMENTDRTRNIEINGKSLTIALKAQSINTLKWKSK